MATILLSLEAKAIDRTAIGGGKVDRDLGLDEEGTIVVGTNLLVVVAIGSDFGDGVSQTSARTEVEGRDTTVRSQDQGQACDLLGSIVGTLGVYPHHPVGQVYRREGRHEQVANASHVGINVVYRVLWRSGATSRGRTAP